MYKLILAGVAVVTLPVVPPALGQSIAWVRTYQPITTATGIQGNPRGSDLAAVIYPAPRSAGEAAPPAMPMDQNYHGDPYHGALAPPPPELKGKVYSTCGGALQDECRNPRGW